MSKSFKSGELWMANEGPVWRVDWTTGGQTLTTITNITGKFLKCKVAETNHDFIHSLNGPYTEANPLVQARIADQERRAKRYKEVERSAYVY